MNIACNFETAYPFPVKIYKKSSLKESSLSNIINKDSAIVEIVNMKDGLGSQFIQWIKFYFSVEVILLIILYGTSLL